MTFYLIKFNKIINDKIIKIGNVIDSMMFLLILMPYSIKTMTRIKGEIS